MRKLTILFLMSLMLASSCFAEHRGYYGDRYDGGRSYGYSRSYRGYGGYSRPYYGRPYYGRGYSSFGYYGGYGYAPSYSYYDGYAPYYDPYVVYPPPVVRVAPPVVVAPRVVFGFGFGRGFRRW